MLYCAPNAILLFVEEEERMVTIIFRVKMKEGKEDEALAALRKMTETVEAQEKSTLAYMFMRPVDNPSEVVLFESYENDDALQAHTKTPHMDELKKAFGELFDLSTVKVERLERVGGFARG